MSGEVEARAVTVEISSYVALGDSFTEGLDDPRDDQAGYPEFVLPVSLAKIAAS